MEAGSAATIMSGWVTGSDGVLSMDRSGRRVEVATKDEWVERLLGRGRRDGGMRGWLDVTLFVQVGGRKVYRSDAGGRWSVPGSSCRGCCWRVARTGQNRESARDDKMGERKKGKDEEMKRESVVE